MPRSFALPARLAAIAASAAALAALAACRDTATAPNEARQLSAADVSAPSKDLVTVTCTAQTCLPQLQIVVARRSWSNASGPEGSSELAVMWMDGWFLRNLTQTTADESDPSVSPDRRQIAYVAESPRGEPNEVSLYVRNFDGTGVTRLVAGLGVRTKPSWSPDGTKLVFIRRVFTQTDVWMVNANGTGLTRVTNDPYIDIAAMFAPDGGSLIVSSSRQQRPGSRTDLNIWHYSLTGQPIRVLGGTTASESWPALAPNGGVAWIENGTTAAGALGKVMRSNLDGSNVQTLVSFPGGKLSSPTFAPDGRFVIFGGPTTPSPSGGSTTALWRKFLETAEAPVRISDPAMITQHPTWTP